MTVAAIIFAISLLVATYYATWSVAHRKGYDKASAEEVSLMAEDLNKFSNMLERILNSTEDLITILDGLYRAGRPDPIFDDEDWEWEGDTPILKGETHG